MTFRFADSFEWDDRKNEANYRKHGIRFETAAEVFNDPAMILEKDRVVDGEQRWHAFGLVRSSVLVVVHVYIEGDENGKDEIIRIVSAREADQNQCSLYFDQAAE